MFHYTTSKAIDLTEVTSKFWIYNWIRKLERILEIIQLLNSKPQHAYCASLCWSQCMGCGQRQKIIMIHYRNNLKELALITQVKKVACLSTGKKYFDNNCCPEGGKYESYQAKLQAQSSSQIFSQNRNCLVLATLLNW